MENYILYICDTETTGLNPSSNEVIEFSILRTFLDSVKEPEQKTWLFKATLPQNISEESLAINGHKRDDILGLTKFGRENYKAPKDILPEIENWISEDDVMVSDRILAGHNVSFDFEMLFEMWKRHGSESTFPFQTGPNKLLIDTKAIALFIDVLVGRKRQQYNLSSIVKDYNIKKEKTHRADSDARMTYEVLMKQIKPFVTIAKEKFSKYENNL